MTPAHGESISSKHREGPTIRRMNISVRPTLATLEARSTIRKTLDTEAMGKVSPPSKRYGTIDTRTMGRISPIRK